MSKVLVALRLEEQTAEKLKELAIKRKRTTSNMIRLILENYVEREEI